MLTIYYEFGLGLGHLGGEVIKIFRKEVCNTEVDPTSPPRYLTLVGGVSGPPYRGRGRPGPLGLSTWTIPGAVGQASLSVSEVINVPQPLALVSQDTAARAQPGLPSPAKLYSSQSRCFIECDYGEEQPHKE